MTESCTVPPLRVPPALRSFLWGLFWGAVHCFIFATPESNRDRLFHVLPVLYGPLLAVLCAHWMPRWPPPVLALLSITALTCDIALSWLVPLRIYAWIMATTPAALLMSASFRHTIFPGARSSLRTFLSVAIVPACWILMMLPTPIGLWFLEVILPLLLRCPLEDIAFLLMCVWFFFAPLSMIIASPWTQVAGPLEQE